jgi:HAD superfamily hydrolase (TIGR01549 family)
MNELIPDTIKLVVFDFDDTLVGTHQPIWNMHRHIAKKYYGIDLDDETLKKHWGQPIDVLAGHYYQTDDTALGVQRILAENANFPKVKFEHTNAVLKKLRDAGKKVGIVTASHMNLIEMDFVTVDMTKDMVDYLQTADDTSVHKPNPAVFKPLIAWAKTRGINKNEILYIGDGLQDMKAARAAGLNFLGVATGLVTQPEFKVNDVDSVEDLSVLL